MKNNAGYYAAGTQEDEYKHKADCHGEDDLNNVFYDMVTVEKVYYMTYTECDRRNNDRFLQVILCNASEKETSEYHFFKESDKNHHQCTQYKLRYTELCSDSKKCVGASDQHQRYVKQHFGGR